MILNWRKPVVWGLLKAKGSPTPKELKFVRSIERKSPEEIREIQRRRLSELLLHAWEHTEYYRDVLDACGVVRNAKVDLDRFEEIPILTKDTIRSEGPKLKAKVIPQGRKPYVNRTGGSTGEPIENWQDNYYWAVNVANKLYHFETLGKEIGEAEMKLWGSDRDIYTDTSSWVVKLANFIYNRKVQSCSNMSESDIRDVIAGINKFRPKNIFCYTDVTYTIAEYANHHGLNLHSPAAIVCGGATFHPHMEQSIEKAFGCPAINYYGSREMGVIASQCREKTGLHIVSHSHSVEIIDQHGNSVLDREGDIVVTSLTNYTMPFIRYRIGDRGKLTDKRCPCGRGFPMLDSVSGRSMESFITANGAFVSPIYLFFSIVNCFTPGTVKKFQIVQDDYLRVTIKIIPSAGNDPKDFQQDLDKIGALLRSILGENCVIAHEFVNEIPPTKSGKYLHTVCKIPTADRGSQRGGQVGPANQKVVL